jgi:hypothetical protein
MRRLFNNNHRNDRSLANHVTLRQQAANRIVLAAPGFGWISFRLRDPLELPTFRQRYGLDTHFNCAV